MLWIIAINLFKDVANIHPCAEVTQKRGMLFLYPHNYSYLLPAYHVTDSPVPQARDERTNKFHWRV